MPPYLRWPSYASWPRPRAHREPELPTRRRPPTTQGTSLGCTSSRPGMIPKPAPEIRVDRVLEEPAGFCSRRMTRSGGANPRTNLLETAGQNVARSGTSHRVQAALGTFLFPSVSYGNTSLPAGDYLALRVAIGPALGANWWCVLFPPLCPVDLERVRVLDIAAITGDSHSSGLHASAVGRLLTLELAVHARPLTLAQLTWEIPAWACRILKWPQLQQAHSR